MPVHKYDPAFFYPFMQIELQNIVPVFFEETQAVQSQVWRQKLSFSGRENIHIIAPSGSGKTSLIHFLYGLSSQYKGEIIIDNLSLKKYDAEKLALLRQKNISIVFQDLRLFNDQTVFENLEIKRLLNPWHKSSNINEMARRLGIENKLPKPCNTCSFGEQQRIAIIRALQQPFEFLLLDEPFSHLDEANRHKAMELIEEEAATRNASIILADLQQIDYFNATHLLML